MTFENAIYEDEAAREFGDAEPKSLVALVGRPNVGKSSLFNRMIGERRAIVEDIAGTTRDRLVGEVEWRGRIFDLVDTGGLAEPTSVQGSGAYMQHIRRQVEWAIDEADLILFVVDARAGLTSADHEVAELLRRTAKPTILVANKADNDRRIIDATEFYELGLGDPRSVSAINSAGSGELLDEICDRLPTLPEERPRAETEQAVRIALIGRPNVGKSALVNSILGEDRVIVSDIAGTTRDAIDTSFTHDGDAMVLIDTAGIRRPGKLEGSIEHYSVVRSKDAVERADVAVVVFDASERMKAQDLHILGLALDAHTGVVLAGNKWDLARENIDKNTLLTSVKHRIDFAPWVPVVFTSAVEGTGLDELLKEAKLAAEERKKRVQTSELNALMRGAMVRRPPPLITTRRLKLLYVTQVKTDPPTFVFFVNDAELVPKSYQRYLENALRRAYGYRGTAVYMIFRSRAADE